MTVKRAVSRTVPLLVLAAALTACGGPAPLPTPRPLVVFSGARLNADPVRMEVVDEYVRRALENIERDPSFWIILQASDSTVFLWEGLEVNAAADTAAVSLERGASDAVGPYQIYAHLHLMAQRDDLEEWLPEAVGAEGFELERAILQRISEVWFYGRALYDFAPYAPLDQLLWSTEAGYLDAYILTARGDEFPEARQRWEAAELGEGEEFRTWFRETFERSAPGSGSGG